MKVFSKIMIAFLAISLFIACKNTPEGEAAKVGDAAKDVATASATAKQFSVTDGTVYWTATKVGGQHSGTITVNRGVLSTDGANLSSGKFGLDMTALQITDGTPDDMKVKLSGHLASPDFFDVENNPNGVFEIVSVAPAAGNEEVTHNITGNLTLKGITKSITFPANVIIAGDKLTAVTPKFTINRLEWDIKYNAGILGTAADKIIHDDISLNIELNAQAQ
ncbi:MAG: polyisoprenoid-binding protein YceI [Saprospiraceae bacterium]|jgi:polyisoprenoid-binding protein YceI